MKFKKILLKLSGEALADKDGRGISQDALENFIKEIKAVRKLGTQIAIVIGGGNFWRERDFRDLGLPRISSDEIGMVATMMNGLLLKAFFENNGIKARVFSAKNAIDSVEDFVSRKVSKSMGNGEVAILVSGTGHPFFTTDSAAVLRALELDCDVILKGTKVDGVYDSDPAKNKSAKMYDKISYEDAIAKNLKVLDKTAFALALEKRVPLFVFNIFKKGALLKAVQGKKVGTLVF